jgi:carotenoid 1,2-hydratase
MTERGQRHVQRERHAFVVGPSQLQWQGDALQITLDERSVPLLRAVRGVLRLHPRALTTFHAGLDGRSLHRWGPIAPCARIEVDLQSPALRWQGHAYFDSNEGDEPIERGFTRWDWLRTAEADGSTAVIYDVQPRDVRRSGASRLVAQRFTPDGSTSAFEASPRQRLAPSALWRIDRQVRAPNAGSPPRVVRTLEDTPFYARSLIDMQAGNGQRVQAVHETLDVQRLVSPVVQAMLPFRMPRRA